MSVKDQRLRVKDILEASLPLFVPTTFPFSSTNFNIWAAVEEPEHKLGGDPPNPLTEYLARVPKSILL